MITIAPMQPEHWEQVKLIYEEGIATGKATFQTTVPNWMEWDAAHTANCRIVAIEQDLVLGWAALTPVSGRCVYAGVAELSIYIAEKARGKKIGTILLQTLITESEAAGYRTLQAGIFAENKASIALHEKCGFRIIGYRERIGKLNNAWYDNVILERRSKTVGIA